MNRKNNESGTGDTRPDAATTELYTQPYSDSTGSTGSTGGTGGTGEQIADKAGQVASQAKDALGDTVGKVRDQAISQVDAQKSRATNALGSIAQAVRQTAENLRQQDQAPIAGYAESAADQIERFSTYLNNRDMADMSIEVQRFARRQPAIFLGGALLAGMLAARFLKSSSQQAQGGSGGQSYYGYSNYGGFGRYQANDRYSSGYGESDYGSYAGSAGSSYGSAAPASASGYGGGTNYGTGYAAGSDAGYGTGTSSGAGSRGDGSSAGYQGTDMGGTSYDDMSGSTGTSTGDMDSSGLEAR